MFNFSNQTQPIADLAARLTDPALEIVAGAGRLGNSVETELKLWHTLWAELERELRLPPTTPRDGVLRRVLQRAAQRVAGEKPSRSENRIIASREVSLS